MTLRSKTSFVLDPSLDCSPLRRPVSTKLAGWTFSSGRIHTKISTANIYTLTDEDGKPWDLRSKTISLGPHVRHTVTVTGTIPKNSKGNGSSVDTAPQNHLLVMSLKMVRDNCMLP